MKSEDSSKCLFAFLKTIHQWSSSVVFPATQWVMVYYTWFQCLTENDLAPCLFPLVHTHKHSSTSVRYSRYFPNGKAHCKKITVKPARALSNYFTVSAQTQQSLFTMQWNVWTLMTDCISPPHCTRSPLKVTRQHIHFSKVITSSAVTCWKNNNLDEKSA